MKHIGPIIALMSAIFLVWFMASVYPKETVTGYTPEMTARMDDLVANLTPLSVADLGEME